MLNRIKVRPAQVETTTIKREIQDALERQGEREAKRIGESVARWRRALGPTQYSRSVTIPGCGTGYRPSPSGSRQGGTKIVTMRATEIGSAISVLLPWVQGDPAGDHRSRAMWQGSVRIRVQS